MSAEDLEIKEMETEDLGFIVEIGNETEELWLDEETKFPFDEDELERWMRWEDKIGFVLVVDDERIGFVLISIDRTMAEIVAFALKEGWRCKGYGKVAMKRVLDKIEERGVGAQNVCVKSDNKEAIKFYSRLGFMKGEEVVPMFRGLDDQVK